MTDRPTNILKKDILISFVLGVLVLTVLTATGHVWSVISSISSLETTSITMFGILITVLALIYTFEDQFSENKAIKRLKRKNVVDDIREVFILSSAAVGAVWVFTFSVSFLPIYSVLPQWTVYSTALFLILGFVLTIVRVWRCFKIFYLLNEAIKKSRTQGSH